VTLRLEDKQAIVAEVAAVAKDALSAVAADYRGLTVDAMTRLRKTARESGIYLRVVRNTLARRAVDGTDFSCMKEALVGPLVLAFSKTEPGAAARLLRDFAKDNEKLEVKVIALGGQLVPIQQLNTVASLPTRDEAIARLMSVMQAPITKLVRTMAEAPTKFVRVVAAVRDQKQAAVSE
jgi:large subunit ribosomal protein L10